MHTTLQPEEGEIISESQYLELYEKIRGTHSIEQCLLSESIATEEQINDMLKKFNLQTKMSFKKIKESDLVICRIRKTDYRSQINDAVFFINSKILL